MAKTFIIILLLMAVAMAMLAVNILIKKNGKFRAEDVGANKEMRKRGIYCSRTQDKLAQAKKDTIKEMMK